MSRDKQIEEMAKDIYSMLRVDSMSRAIASMLYGEGYRKSEDVAREIFEEIEKLMNSLDGRYMASGNPKQSWGVRGAMAEIAELKKNYTESENDNGKI